MGLAARVIPCLDVRAGRVVKGVRFGDLRDTGAPVEVARRYDEEGADELCFLDITASHEGREATLNMVTEVARQLRIPLTVGGGVASVAAFSRLLSAGADKVSVNSAALAAPELIRTLAQRFGSQCVVVAIDARLTTGGSWTAYSHGGRLDSGRDVLAWAQQAEQLGAGELLLTSMDNDGVREGFDLPMISTIAAAVAVPVIASGGAGSAGHFAPAIAAGAAAVLAAGVFHDRLLSIAEAKAAMAAAGIEVVAASCAP